MYLLGGETFPTGVLFARRSPSLFDAKHTTHARFELREEKDATALRNLLHHVYYECSDDEKPLAVREFARELRDLKERMQVYLGYDRERIGISVKLISYNFTVPRFLTKPLYPHKPHLAFIRDVITELASVSTMGRLVDLLWRNRKTVKE